MRKRLSRDEKERFVRATALHFFSEPGLGFENAVYKGMMETLPEGKLCADGRQAKATWPWLRDEVDSVVEDFKLEEEEARKREAEVESTEKSLEDLLGEIMARFILPQITSAIDIAVSQALRSKVVLTTKEPEETSKERLPSVAIVGLLPRQQQIIRKEFEKEFDLRFYKFVRDNVSLWDRVKNVDTVIAANGFISHAQYHVLKKHPHCINLRGGLTEVRDELTRLYVHS